MNGMNSFSVRVVSHITSLVLAMVVGLAGLAACSKPAPKLGNPLPLSSPLGALKSPVVLPMATAPAASFQLTVLHTNDTWGYLFPCG
jgi:2',3'-cyclic-nucleotide 2'-phosphodiesterase (5'-nucleotidase family)